MSKSLTSLIVFLLLTLAASLVGLFTPPGDWYAAMQKPAWTPPDVVFGPVWTALYILIAISGWRLWQQPASGTRRRALVFWGLQLVLNALWSVLFFGLHRPGWAMAEILLLWVAIFMTQRLAYRVDRLAGHVLWPYLLWVSFAALLNFHLWRLNGGGPGSLLG